MAGPCLPPFLQSLRLQKSRSLTAPVDLQLQGPALQAAGDVGITSHAHAAAPSLASKAAGYLVQERQDLLDNGFLFRVAQGVLHGSFLLRFALAFGEWCVGCVGFCRFFLFPPYICLFFFLLIE